MFVISGIVFGPGVFNYMFRYKVDVYDCSEMSRDLEDWFEGFGLDTVLVRGKRVPGDSVSHLWVRVCGVDIDSVLFLPVYPCVRNPYGRVCFDDYDEVN